MNCISQTIRMFLFVALLIASAGTALAQSTTSRTTKDGIHYSWYRSDNDGYEIGIRGDVEGIEFTADERGIKSIAPGGSFRFKETRGRSSQVLEIRPGRDGSLVYEYEVDGRRREIDAKAREEIGEFILKFIRESGYKADERVARILRSDGVDGVFREIDLIDSGSSRARYYTELVVQADLSTRNLVRVAQQVDHDVKSSGSRSRFLMATAHVFMADRGTWEAYFQTVENIPSSGDRTRVLTSLLDLKLGEEGLTLLLESARTIPSSGDKSRLLVAASTQYTTNSALQTAYFDVVDSIPSSGDRTRVLLSLLENGNNSESTVERIFMSAAGIPSSGDRARLLVETAPSYAESARHRQTYFQVVNEIPSSGDHARVLTALLERKDLGKETLLSVLHSASKISSSSDKSRVLVKAAPLMSDDELVEAYLSAAESIPSSSEQARALTALVRSN